MARASTFVDAGEPASGDYRRCEGGEDGARPFSVQFRSFNGAAHLARESENFERVTVWPMALDRLRAVVPPAHGGPEDPHPGGRLVRRQRAWR